MEPLYSAGCSYYYSLAGVPEIGTDSVYLTCLTLTKSSNHSGLLTSSILIFCALLYRYTITPAFLSKVYGSSYTRLQPSQQKKFRLHHVGLVLKMISLILIILPIFWVFVRGFHWSEPLYNNSRIDLGDLAFMSITTVAALFIFQMLFEEETKLVHIVHHICGILAIQGIQVWGVSIPVNRLLSLASFAKVAEMCLLWILFSGVYSVLTTSNNILRRSLSPGGALLHRLYYFTAYSTSAITVVEALAVLYPTLSGSPQSDLSLKVVIFLLQVLFTGSKALTTRTFLSMGKEQKRQYETHPIKTLIARDGDGKTK
ncbi:hypothetical protein ASPVEDRAFT_47683 [Aspergillus versicolor CBS 583.65]|uniref:TLC domain-containing protein n=1 Tax=Aspergillus versicolor CBS 583.65 TaxID=1036611 RepID=A0A1L9Q447_ASPVE|nr:uncharacterized protein ASPVEDRAFT_47683 [Aspergillus versicolor CBS 583.65]OJJ08540.1 hypothetical protein ASPVEDRAFT_47683 [Aspergillus versicolor CBS 583.65]